MRFVILALVLAGCAKPDDVKTATAAPVITPAPVEEILPTPTPVVSSPKCASSPAIGDWKNGPLSMVTATIAADCSLRIHACGTTYELDLVDPTFSAPQNVTVRVRSYDFVQDGCLRPLVGDFACSVHVVRDGGLQRTVLALQCADDNFYHTGYSATFFRPY